eukprot:TRINITY_DN14980_c0_g1_i1.p1 TRINITY_DN14980_c0_g1~~TRINITY_DN14980_c0_g1_i1.p1  ORF type:complete len:196 (-),score=26.59 TRINITY_DN14980_c0_g1_i1:244-831(-)
MTTVDASSFVTVSEIHKSIVSDIRYATYNNFTGKVLYPRSGCFVRRELAASLVRVQDELNKLGYGLKIWDAYRPLHVQRLLWTVCPDDNYVANPDQGSRHNRGCALDVTLISLQTGEELEMPTPFDEFTSRAHRGQHDGVSELAQQNSALLERIMCANDFEGLPTEWWHFDHRAWKQCPIADVSFDEIDAACAAL